MLLSSVDDDEDDDVEGDDDEVVDNISSSSSSYSSLRGKLGHVDERGVPDGDWRFLFVFSRSFL